MEIGSRPPFSRSSLIRRIVLRVKYKPRVEAISTVVPATAHPTGVRPRKVAAGAIPRELATPPRPTAVSAEPTESAALEVSAARPPVAPKMPAADTRPKLLSKVPFPRTNAPIQVLDKVPAIYPAAPVEAIHAPDECRTGIAMANRGKGMSEIPLKPMTIEQDGKPQGRGQVFVIDTLPAE
jgi:hypothetical protein